MIIEYWKQLEGNTPVQWAVALLCIAFLYFWLHVFPYKFPKQARKLRKYYFGE